MGNIERLKYAFRDFIHGVLMESGYSKDSFVDKDGKRRLAVEDRAVVSGDYIDLKFAK